MKTRWTARLAMAVFAAAVMGVTMFVPTRAISNQKWEVFWREHQPEVEFMNFTKSGKKMTTLQTWTKSNTNYGVGTKKIPTGYEHQGGIVTQDYYIFSVYGTDTTESYVYFARRSDGKIVASKKRSDFGHMNSFDHDWGTNYVRIKRSYTGGPSIDDICYDFSDINNVKKVALSNCGKRTPNLDKQYYTGQGEAGQDSIYDFAIVWDCGSVRDIKKPQANFEKQDTNALLIYRKDGTLYKVVQFDKPLGEMEDVSVDANGDIYLFQHFHNRDGTSGKSCAFYKINRADLALDEKLVLPSDNGDSGATPTPEPAPESTPIPESTPESTPTPESEPTPESTSEPEPAIEPTPESEIEPTPEPVVEDVTDVEDDNNDNDGDSDNDNGNNANGQNGTAGNAGNTGNTGNTGNAGRAGSASQSIKEAIDNLPNSGGVSGSFLTNLLYWIYAIGGLIAVVVIIYGGVMYNTAQGDPGKVKQATQIIALAVVGLIIVILASAITALVTNIISGAV